MPDLSPWLWMVTFLTGLVASAVTTITSIGSGLIVYGVLSFFLDLKSIIAFIAPAQLFAVSLRSWLFRSHIHWRLAGYFFLGVVPGIYCGAALYHVLPELVLRRALGAFLLASAVSELRQQTEARVAPRLWILPLGGFCAGVLSGSIGIAGPLVAVVFLRYGLMKEELVAMIALYFLLGNAQRTLLYWQQGALLKEHFGLAVVIGIGMLVGVYVGRCILPRVSRQLFVRLVLGMLILFGIQFLVWS